MDIHKNARLTLRSREDLVRLVVFSGMSLALAARQFRVTRKTAAKWVARYRLEGWDGLQDRSSRPRHSPTRLPDVVVSQIIELRLQHTPGYEIARRTGVSPASISRILRRVHLSRWRDLHPAPAVQRYEHAAPGDLLHLDIKGLTRFDEVLMRGDGRRRGLRKHPGSEALHIAIDDHSRMAFTQILPDQKTPTTIGFLRDALAYFASHGIRVRALLTDNGSSYRSHQFRQECGRLGIKHRRTKPYSPQTNGKAERFIQTALREWAYAKHWQNSDERDQYLAPWNAYYNFARPHGSLNYKPPISRADPSTTS
jgi:transposase InsO family protein